MARLVIVVEVVANTELEDPEAMAEYLLDEHADDPTWKLEEAEWEA